MYEFYLDGVRLPVTPGEITMSNGANIDVVDLANGQKITRWVGRDLETITFKASFPFTRYASFVDSGLKQPSYYIDKFMGLMRSGTPFQFVMFDSEVYNPFYNALSETPKSSSNKAFVKTMYIQSLQRTESAENGSEVEMEFTLLEWVEKETQTYTVYGKSIDISVNENEDSSNSNFAEEFDDASILTEIAVRSAKSGYVPHKYVVYRGGPLSLKIIAWYFFRSEDSDTKANLIKNMNPHLKNKQLSEALEYGTIVKLRDIEPYDLLEPQQRSEVKLPYSPFGKVELLNYEFDTPKPWKPSDDGYEILEDLFKDFE